MKRYIILISMLLTLLTFNTGCEDYLDVNKNIDAPAEIDGYLYLSQIIQAMPPYWDAYHDLYAIAPMVEMVSTTNSVYTGYANHYLYSLTSDVGAVQWRTVYFSQGMNLENFINQSVAQEEWTFAGIGLAVKAFGWDMLTKIYGEAPLKEAFTTGHTEYDYDYQPEIYDQVRQWAYKAIEYLEMEDPHVYASKLSANDWIYKGDKEKWIKFAYAVIVRNLTSLTRKRDFVSKYADELIAAAGKSFQSTDDDATVEVAGGSDQTPYTYYNNYWGTRRGVLSNTTVQSDYAVQVMTGTVPKYDDDWKRTKVDQTDYTHEDSIRAEYYPYELREDQIICDTAISMPGHYDPRVAVKLSAYEGYLNIDNADSVKRYRYFGGQTATSKTSPQGTIATSFYGRSSNGVKKTETETLPNDGEGRWLYHNHAPYILTTYAEIKFCLAEAYWYKGDKGAALAAFKEGVKADNAFTAKYLKPGAKLDEDKSTGGDKISVAVFNTLAREYEDGPYCGGMSEAELTLSHIMMQKWVALYFWGAVEAWCDLRKYHYDIEYQGDYPYPGNGWDAARYIITRKDDDPSKVYQGFYLGATRNVEFRNAPFSINNQGSPCYRIRPRYNSEYVWNLQKLSDLKPIPGTAPFFQCSIPWFAYPGDYPDAVNGWEYNTSH